VVTSVPQNTIRDEGTVNFDIMFDAAASVVEKGNTGIGLLEKYNKYPENKKLFIRFINGINKLGWNVDVRSTNRSYAEQAAIHIENSNNAAPGHSTHESGGAIDINIINRNTGVRLKKLSPKEDWIASGVPGLARSMGLQWAGGDGSFGKYVDRVHFQIRNSRETEQAETQVEQFEEYTEDVKTKGLDRDAVFSNFKVNNFVFNFFQKGLQFDPEYRIVTSRIVQTNSGGLLQEAKLSNR
jgi:hypothetical protein